MILHYNEISRWDTNLIKNRVPPWDFVYLSYKSEDFWLAGRTWTCSLRVMSCAPGCGLGLSSTFQTSSHQSKIPSRALSSIVPTAFFLFWVKLWVRAPQDLRGKGFLSWIHTPYLCLSRFSRERLLLSSLPLSPVNFRLSVRLFMDNKNHLRTLLFVVLKIGLLF